MITCNTVAFNTSSRSFASAFLPLFFEMDFPIPFPDLIPSTTFSFTSAYPTPFPCNSATSATQRSAVVSDPSGRVRRRKDDQGNARNGQWLRGSASRRGERQTEQLRRALLGMEDDISDQEDYVYRSDMRVKHFGQDYLLPIGRRQTQHEFDTAGSPTPSDAQEGAPPNAQQGQGDETPPAQEEGEGSPQSPQEEEVEVDLDADMDDRDADDGESEEAEESGTSAGNEQEA